MKTKYLVIYCEDLGDSDVCIGSFHCDSESDAYKAAAKEWHIDNVSFGTFRCFDFNSLPNTWSRYF